MNQSDRVRGHCVRTFVEPARRRGATSVAIRAGEVHKSMGLVDQHPLVCDALWARLFEKLAAVRRPAERPSPRHGASTEFVFKIL